MIIFGNQQKKVSLIIATYNCKDNLVKTFKSIEEQDYPNIEVCISDSCSLDYEFMLRFLKDGNKLAYVPETLISMFYGGTSTSTATSYVTSIKEAL